MTVSVAEAVQALNNTVVGLLPVATNADLASEVLVNPVKTHLAGIGGHIGNNREPAGEIFARSLTAQVVVRLKANSLADLGNTESNVTNNLIGADQTLLRSQGIFRISRDTDFSQFYNGAEDGISVAVGKDIRFDIEFEFQRPPDTASGLISTIPFDLLSRTTGNPVEQLFQGDFTVDPLVDFTAFDDTSANAGPGNWLYNDVLGRIEQNSSVSGGSNAFNASKRGTCLVLRPELVPSLPENWLLHLELGADSGGIGAVFNFQDIDNYYFFIMSLPTPYRLLGRKEGGNFTFLDSGGQDNGNAYSPGDHSLRLIQQSSSFQLAFDNVPIMQAAMDQQPAVGSVGLFCRNSASARFQSMRWIAL